jgi:hypothetical protein
VVVVGPAGCPTDERLDDGADAVGRIAGAEDIAGREFARSFI